LRTWPVGKIPIFPLKVDCGPGLHIQSAGRQAIISFVDKTLRLTVAMAVLAGLFTMNLDFGFHALFTEPMEVPAYFVAKFALALVVALFLPLTFELKTYAKGALAYTVLFTLLYYGVGLYVLRIPGLSVWSYYNGVSFTVFGESVSLVVFGAIEVFVHFGVFLAGSLLASRLVVFGAERA